MAKRPRIPKYSLHKASGRARVILNGRHIFLGKYGSEESLERYNRLVAELASSAAGRTSTAAVAPPCDQVTVAEVLAAYLRHAEGYYQKSGQPTDQLALVKLALRPVRELYARAPVSEFGPLALKAVRVRMIEAGLCRKEVNRRVRLVRQCFRWAVAEEMIPPAVHQALAAVDGLRKGRTEAPDHPPVEPVADEVVEATLAFLPSTVADMVRLQRLSGCRPGEVCGIRPCDVERSTEAWVYTPATHKTEHLDKARTIYFGPRAQDVLRPYLLRPAEQRCFSPADSERKRLAELHAKRKTPLSCGNRPGTNRKTRPKRKPRDAYDVKSYRQAIIRAVKKANAQRTKEAAKRGEKAEPIPAWAPNQLRHSAATEIRKVFGLEDAGAVLGHSKLDTTEIYAQRNAELARTVAMKIG